MSHADIIKAAGISASALASGNLIVHSPIDGVQIAKLEMHTPEDAKQMIAKSKRAFLQWRDIPAPRRGELVRLFGEALREEKENLGRLVSLECGKIEQEGFGEVQEMIDICDLAVGLSRQLYGLTIASERPGHTMRETWHPMGVCAVITAFNFPVAVAAWNGALALVCGNPVIWKPSEKAPLTALAVGKIFDKALKAFGDAPDDLFQIVVGDYTVGEVLSASNDIAILSATGSTRMGRMVGPIVSERFGRSILELGGNNAMIVTPSADLEMALRAIVFSAVGTCGQRCTSLRRLFVHESIYSDLVPRLTKAYQTLPVGNPLEDGTLVGPMIDEESYQAMQSALTQAVSEGGKQSGGERVLQDKYPDGYYVSPAIVEMPAQTNIVREETFAPILYVMPYQDIDKAIHSQNDVKQGLSSCIFTNDVREAETFLSASGSDCGIANVNIGPSGAEIGGAFGGEKETGGGRESGSDAWKGYMRRQTNTVNYSRELPLAQGIKFDIEA